MVFSNKMELRSSNKSKLEQPMEYSPQSVLHAMEKFNTAVGHMQNNVLVPCRLQDISDPQMGDLHAAYKLLAKTKEDLLFGDDSKKLSMRPGRYSRQNTEKLNSSVLDTPVDQNSPPNEDPELGNVDPKMMILHASLNQNLKNLHAILEQMTEAANQVTSQYLKEVGDF